MSHSWKNIGIDDIQMNIFVREKENTIEEHIINYKYTQIKTNKKIIGAP